MAGLAVDQAAWASKWRERALLDKCVLCLGLLLCALLLPPWPGAVLVTGTTVGIAVSATGTPWLLLARSMRAPLLFIGLGAASVAVTMTASPHFSVGVTAESMTRAGEVTGRAIAGTTAVLLLAVTTPVSDIITGLRRMHVPDACIDVAALMYRMVFILLDSLGTIRESQTARLGYTSPRRSMASAGLLGAAVLTRAWDRARRLESGLAGRQFSNSMRTLERRRLSSPRFVIASVAVVILIVSTSLAVTGGWSR
ncbi:MAG: cobalt ECF transporter T component CbiQ [Rhodococcus sp. (in: high G+C Gram-positive bacteria)]|uniref:cobalt ECF transporter T component CbiQ n=1 Tax=Rhodococcus sp. TaxID=1831 RepID=UPI002ADCD4D4|nr:cobalt ECF transporter T component CbiQ [Rhodococcus sp. (in: high G+C Gram-positive bacteria)]